jgi:hypothetical protein
MLVGDRDYYCPLGWQPTIRRAPSCGPGPGRPEARARLFSNDPTMAARLAGADQGVRRQEALVNIPESAVECRRPSHRAESAGRLLASPEPVAPAALTPDWLPDVPPNRPPVPAAVLIGLIRRARVGLSVLYTERSPDLRSHSGQIAFPGGKIDPEDAVAGGAALREAWEEVAMLQRGMRASSATCRSTIPARTT